MAALYVWLYITLKPLFELCFALYDQTHLHVQAFKAYARITISIVLDYFKCWFVYYAAHRSHLQYLHEIGFLDTSDLVDSGRLVVFKERDASGFLIHSTSNCTASGFFSNTSGNPAHLPISSVAITQMWAALECAEVSLPEATFIDFGKSSFNTKQTKPNNTTYTYEGCGTGFALLSAMMKPLRAVIGVDLHKKSTVLAKRNVHAFAEHNGSIVKCRNVTVSCEDMATFTNYPTDGATILYMYEPLWTVPKLLAHCIYKKVLTQARKASSGRLVVAYFYAGRYDGDCLPALLEMNAELLYQEKYISLFFETLPENLYLYEVPPLPVNELEDSALSNGFPENGHAHTRKN